MGSQTNDLNNLKRENKNFFLERINSLVKKRREKKAIEHEMKNELKNSLESLNTLNKNLKKSTTEGNWNEILEEINYHKSKLENINNTTTSFSLSANSSAALMGIENLTKKVMSAQKKEVVNLFAEINNFKNIVSEINNNESAHLNGNWKGFIEEINNYLIIRTIKGYFRI